jgi:hypothetical protein
VNALAFGKTIEENCRTLQNVYKRCLEWARRHGASFAPEKYILVHFTSARTKHNTACPLTLPSLTIFPSLSARVLGVILDKKLSWQPHLQHIKSKLATQTNVLTWLTASTWGASLRVLRLLYTAAVRPPSPLAVLHGGPPLIHHSFEKGLEKSYRKLKTDASEL